MRYTLAVQDEYKEVFKPNGVPALKTYRYVCLSPAYPLFIHGGIFVNIP